VEANDASFEQREGLAFFWKEKVASESVVPCASIGTPILHRPIMSYLNRRKAEQFAQEKDVAAGRVQFPENTAAELAARLAERIEIHPLVITSGWSDVARR